MAWGADVCGTRDLAVGEIGEFLVGGTPVALARLEDGFHAVSNVCPHAGGPIGDGELDGALASCPLHGWRFDVRTGACETVPSLTLAVYEVRTEGDRVRVLVPS